MSRPQETDMAPTGRGGPAIALKPAFHDIHDVKGTQETLNRFRTRSTISKQVEQMQSDGDNRRRTHFGSVMLDADLMKLAVAENSNINHHPLVTYKGRGREFMLKCDQIAESSWFGKIMFIAILVAAVQSGLETNPNFDGGVAMFALSEIIKYLFTLEVVLKICATIKWPYLYFYLKMPKFTLQSWNIFDFFIVALMYLDIKGVAALRLLRLMRLLKLVRAITTLRLLLAGLFMSMGSIVYIFMMLLLMFFVFAIIGMLLFSSASQEFFGSMLITLVTLFAMSTGGSWTDVMYGVIFDTCEYDGEEHAYPGCTRLDKNLGWLGFVYFSLFVLLSAMVILNLVIGVITQSMDATRKSREEEVAIEKQETPPPGPVMAKIKKLALKLRLIGVEVEEEKEVTKLHTLNFMMEEHIDTINDVKRCMNNIFRRSQNIENVKRQESIRRAVLEIDDDVIELSWSELTGRQKLYRCVQFMDKLAYHQWFSNFTLAFVIVAAILIAMQSDPGMTDNPDLDTVEMVVTIVFTIECIFKFMACGLRPHMFFFTEVDPVLCINYWNIVDLVVVVASYLNVSAVAILRLLRLVRLLKLVRALPTLQMLLVGLIRSMSSMVYVFCLLMLLFYIFGIVGIMIFGANDKVHFGNLGLAMITLMQCATLDNWTDILYVNMYGCDWDEDMIPSHMCTDPTKSPVVAVVYFVLFIMLSAMVVLNLVIGVITSSMDEVNEEMKAERELQTFEKECERAGALEVLPARMKQTSELIHLLTFHQTQMVESFKLLKARTPGPLVMKEAFPLWFQDVGGMRVWNGKVKRIHDTHEVMNHLGAEKLLKKIFAGYSATSNSTGGDGFTRTEVFDAWKEYVFQAPMRESSKDRQFNQRLAKRQASFGHLVKPSTASTTTSPSVAAGGDVMPGDELIAFATDGGTFVSESPPDNRTGTVTDTVAGRSVITNAASTFTKETVPRVVVGGGGGDAVVAKRLLGDEGGGGLTSGAFAAETDLNSRRQTMADDDTTERNRQLQMQMQIDMQRQLGSLQESQNQQQYATQTPPEPYATDEQTLHARDETQNQPQPSSGREQQMSPIRQRSGTGQPMSPTDRPVSKDTARFRKWAAMQAEHDAKKRRKEKEKEEKRREKQARKEMERAAKSGVGSGLLSSSKERRRREQQERELRASGIEMSTSPQHSVANSVIVDPTASGGVAGAISSATEAITDAVIKPPLEAVKGFMDFFGSVGTGIANALSPTKDDDDDDGKDNESVHSTALQRHASRHSLRGEDVGSQVAHAMGASRHHRSSGRHQRGHGDDVDERRQSSRSRHHQHHQSQHDQYSVTTLDTNTDGGSSVAMATSWPAPIAPSVDGVAGVASHPAMHWPSGAGRPSPQTRRDRNYDHDDAASNGSAPTRLDAFEDDQTVGARGNQQHQYQQQQHQYQLQQQQHQQQQQQMKSSRRQPSFPAPDTSATQEDNFDTQSIDSRHGVHQAWGSYMPDDQSVHATPPPPPQRASRQGGSSNHRTARPHQPPQQPMAVAEEEHHAYVIGRGAADPTRAHTDAAGYVFDRHASVHSIQQQQQQQQEPLLRVASSAAMSPGSTPGSPTARARARAMPALSSTSGQPVGGGTTTDVTASGNTNDWWKKQMADVEAANKKAGKEDFAFC